MSKMRNTILAAALIAMAPGIALAADAAVDAGTVETLPVEDAAPAVPTTADAVTATDAVNAEAATTEDAVKADVATEAEADVKASETAE